MSENQDKPAPETVAGAEPPPEAAPAAEPTPEERIVALEAEVAALKDKWLRAEAEMQNLRARTQRDVADARAYAAQKFARDVVEAAENLRRGLDAMPAKQEGEPEVLGKIRDGIEGVERSFLGILERNGVRRDDPTGKPFDPDLHQAMAEQPAPEGVAPGTVTACWTPAWTLNGRLLKPAMVVVAQGRAT
ncbi:nucleotide exchange factor GrpE [Roseomonas sp. PWR1]|uniref:Protein GrpE n=2 Tax=Roseomonas nitratireducens TaxID=2820810 RepID=A0ABS4AWM6_9PROT|nr:nucleotide exchange factor GrpE [Neoroseomonas nitratireducens]MBP0465767.1 nucleotide exchange factor GrpE [Neoroseomonas nitratireducens]